MVLQKNSGDTAMEFGGLVEHGGDPRRKVDVLTTGARSLHLRYVAFKGTLRSWTAVHFRSAFAFLPWPRQAGSETLRQQKKVRALNTFHGSLSFNRVVGERRCRN